MQFVLKEIYKGYEPEEIEIRYKELENEDLDGIFMRDIIREDIKPDDPRLQ